MYKQSGNNLLRSPFLLLIDFINNKNRKLNLNVSLTDNEDIVSEFDSDIFFKAGQLLMFFYIINVNNICKENIKYKNTKFYINITKENESNENCIEKITSENIINNLIQKSTYNKEFLPVELNNINKENLLKIENGFELTYKTFIDEKMNLISYINEYSFNDSYLNLIKDIKLLNPHDLDVQLQFIRLKLGNKIISNRFVEKVVSYKSNHEQFIESITQLLDLLNKYAIISLDENGMQLMWIGYINCIPQPIKYRNIYIAILFAYMGKKTCEKYYLQLAKYSINPLLMDMNYLNDDKNILDDEFYEILKLLYLLNNFIEFEELNKFIEQNTNLFDLVTLEDKIKCNSENENLILEYINNKSLDVLNLLIL